jgi:lipoprotein
MKKLIKINLVLLSLLLVSCGSNSLSSSISSVNSSSPSSSVNTSSLSTISSSITSSTSSTVETKKLTELQWNEIILSYSSIDYSTIEKSTLDESQAVAYISNTTRIGNQVYASVEANGSITSINYIKSEEKYSAVETNSIGTNKYEISKEDYDNIRNPYTYLIGQYNKFVFDESQNSYTSTEKISYPNSEVLIADIVSFKLIINSDNKISKINYDLNFIDSSALIKYDVEFTYDNKDIVIPEAPMKEDEWNQIVESYSNIDFKSITSGYLIGSEDNVYSSIANCIGDNVGIKDNYDNQQYYYKEDDKYYLIAYDYDKEEFEKSEVDYLVYSYVRNMFIILKDKYNEFSYDSLTGYYVSTTVCMDAFAIVGFYSVVYTKLKFDENKKVTNVQYELKYGDNGTVHTNIDIIYETDSFELPNI